MEEEEDDKYDGEGRDEWQENGAMGWKWKIG